MKITVFSSPACPGCTQTCRKLDEWEIPYTKVDVTQDEEALKSLKKMGLSQLPVVETEEDIWTGFRPDLIKELAERFVR